MDFLPKRILITGMIGARPIAYGVNKAMHREGAGWPSPMTMSSLGAVRTMPHYNLMGMTKASLEASVRYLAMQLGRQDISANGISAGPIKTLAAAGIVDFSKLLSPNEKHAPLKRNVNIEDGR